MRTKSKYREPKLDIPPVEEIPEPNIPAVEINGDAQEPVIAASVEAEPQAVVAAIEADDASAALKRQIDALNAGQQLQQQHQAAMLANLQPPSREQLLQQWREQGLSEAESAFLEANGELVDNPRLLAMAAAEAGKHHQRGTEEYLNETKNLFHEALRFIKIEEGNETAKSMQSQPPSFFRPPSPRPAPPTEPSRASIVSAPVSREAPGSREPYEPSPSRVTLTQDELQIAQASGITPAEYARQKIRLRKELASGERQR